MIRLIFDKKIQKESALAIKSLTNYFGLYSFKCNNIFHRYFDILVRTSQH